MPNASIRTSRNTRVSGGPIFWFFYAMFIVPLWLMGQMLKGAILLVAWIGRETSAHRARKNTPTPVPPPPAIDPDTEPQDAVPDCAKPAPAPQRHPLLIAAAILACALLATLAALGKINL